MFFSIMDINTLEYSHQSFIQILIQNPLNHPQTLVKGLIGYVQQDVSLNDYHTTKYSINELTDFKFWITSHKVRQKHWKNYCLSLSKQQEREYKSQQKKFIIPFDVSKITEADKEFLTIFNFEHTKLT